MWLGEGHWAGSALATVQVLADYAADHLYSRHGDPEGLDPLKVLDQAQFMAVDSVFRNAYWERHWVAQEILVSRHHSRTLWYGKERLDFDKWRELESLVPMIAPNWPWEPSRPSVKLISADSHATNDGGFLIWKEAMDLARSTTCSDLRDKIYGIQSIFDEYLRIEVDYTKSVRDVYLDAVHHYDEKIQATHVVIQTQIYEACAYLAVAMGLDVKEDCLDKIRAYVNNEGYVEEATKDHVRALEKVLGFILQS